jgi:hypothetical protein
VNRRDLVVGAVRAESSASVSLDCGMSVVRGVNSITPHNYSIQMLKVVVTILSGII